MIRTISQSEQGRARGLYDEQLQRQQQEKWLLKNTAPEATVKPDEAPSEAGEQREADLPPERRRMFFQLRLDREQDDIDFARDL